MAWFPIMIDLGGQPCLVAGGGATALRKAKALLQAGAQVTVVSLEFAAGFDSLAVDTVRRAVREEDVRGMSLVADATGDVSTAAMLRQACHDAGIPFNCAAHAQAGDVAFPAVFRRGELVAGISTSGGSPAAAAWVRDRLDQCIPENFEEILGQLETLRGQAKSEWPQQAQRACFLHSCLEQALKKGTPLSQEEIDDIRRTIP